MDLFENISFLSALPAVSGRESMAHAMFAERFGGLFDNIKFTSTGSIIASKLSGSPNAKKILLDAHIDEVGFLVSDITDSGFVKVTAVGGIDTAILSAAEVLIYGSETITGVFTSKPPHLQEANESEKKPKLKELFIDTGYSAEKLKKIAPPGTPVAFRNSTVRMLGSRICGKSFDDRLCMLAILRAIELLSEMDYSADIYALFASGEETGYSGAMTGTYEVAPDVAIALDVCNAYVNGADEFHKAKKMGGGPVISFSATTDREYTKKLIKTAEKHSVSYQLIAEPSQTGTDAHVHQLVRDGIPGVLMSIPLYNMHTYNEIADLKDAEAAAKLLAYFVSEL